MKIDGTGKISKKSN